MLAKCIDDAGATGIVKGKIYAVEETSVDPTAYLIRKDGSNIYYMKDRFTVLKSYRVRSRETHSSGLVKDQIYEVIDYPTDKDCWMTPPYTSSDGYYKTRFTDPIDDSIPMGSRPLHVGDMIEEKYRKILTTRAYPNECICGTNRSECIYHKNPS